MTTQAPPSGRDVAALDAEEWHQALRDLAGSTRYDAALARDAVRRCQAGLLSASDVRLLLLVTGTAPGWAPVRRTAIEALAHDPETAWQVLVAHTQAEVWPPLRFEEAAQPQEGTAGDVIRAAVIGPAGHHVTGPARRARTSRDAKNQAALALLARLAGVPVPGEEPADGHEVERLVLPGMPSEVFEHRLNTALEAGEDPGAELEEEALRRAHAGRLRHRDMHVLILATPGRAWTRMRSAALERAAAMPPTPATLLHWHAAQHGEERGLSFEEVPDSVSDGFRVRALLQAGRTTWTGPLRGPFSRKVARHYAACALLAQLADLPEPAVQIKDEPAQTQQITIPGQGQDPVKHLNKHYQREAITRPESQLRQLGSRVECTYSCRHTKSGTKVTATGAGPDKVAARRAAALKLLHKLRSLDTAPPATRAPTAVAPAHPPAGPVRQEPGAALPGPPVRPSLAVDDWSAQALLLAAFTAGCPVVFVPAGPGRAAAWWVQDTGRESLPVTGLPAPLTPGHSPAGAPGWWAPITDGLYALRRADADTHVSAVFWQRALHIALQLVRAQLIYPALDDGDRATWRVGPLPAPAQDALTALGAAAPLGAVPEGAPVDQVLTECCDAVADALVRTPAAAVFGTSPWTAPEGQPVAAEAPGQVRRWLDQVEDLADGGPAPVLILHVQQPSDDQAAAGRLTADLCLAPADTGPDSDPVAEVPAERVWSGAARLGGENAGTVRPRVRRALRRAGRMCPALTVLAGQSDPQRFTLHAGAIEALLEQEAQLAQAGLRVVWPERLRTALQPAAVIGTDPETGPSTGSVAVGERPRFSVTALLDFRWQVALEGVELSEEEMNALAEAARPLVRVRGRWVLADPLLRSRARHRLLGSLPGTQALTAALTGTLTVADNLVPCRATGALAEVMGVLSQGEHHPGTVSAPNELRASLRGYQERALTWLVHTTTLGFGAVLADDMGLGKTLTALAFTLHHQQRTPGPTLVICPASLVTNWRREAARFAPSLPVVDYHGPHRTLDAVTDTTMVITTYGILRRDQALLAARHWSLVIADEAQNAKTPRPRRPGSYAPCPPPPAWR